MKKLVIATGNQGKVREVKEFFSRFSVDVVSLREFPGIPEAVEDGQTFQDNALIKARHYAKHTGCACLADDSGLEVDALGGEPGVYSARYAGENATDEENNQKLLASLAAVAEENRGARFRCALALVDGEQVVAEASGTCEGEIIWEGRGTNGFGYDPLFFIRTKNKTLAELPMEEKNAMSHRGKALAAMAEKLKGYWSCESE